jgi:hypothetical protein
MFLFPFQFQAVDGFRQKYAHFSAGRHHCHGHRFANFIVGRARFLCTCKVVLGSMSTPGDRSGGKKHEFAGAGIQRTGNIFEPHEVSCFFRFHTFVHGHPLPPFCLAAPCSLREQSRLPA